MWFHPKRKFFRPSNQAATGSGTFAPAVRRGATTKEEQDVMLWLATYSGNFALITSIASQLKHLNGLSDKQWAAAIKCYNKEVKHKNELNRLIANSVNTKPLLEGSLPIVIKRFKAQELKQTFGLNFTPFCWHVKVIHVETAKAYYMTAELNMTDAGVCSCCGKKLTDWRSIATGVGAQCARNLGVAYVKDKADVARFKQEMKLICDKVGQKQFWIPKAQIKDGLSTLNMMISVNKSIPLPMPKVDSQLPQNIVMSSKINDSILSESAQVIMRFDEFLTSSEYRKYLGLYPYDSHSEFDSSEWDKELYEIYREDNAVIINLVDA